MCVCVHMIYVYMLHALTDTHRHTHTIHVCMRM
jgi:hypothetical protein